MLASSVLSDLILLVKKNAQEYEKAERARLLNVTLNLSVDLSDTIWESKYGIHHIEIENDNNITLKVDLLFFGLFGLFSSYSQLGNFYINVIIISRELYDKSDKKKLKFLYSFSKLPYIEFESSISLSNISCKISSVYAADGEVTINEVQYFNNSSIECSKFSIEESDFELFKQLNTEVVAGNYKVFMKLSEYNLANFERWLASLVCNSRLKCLISPNRLAIYLILEGETDSTVLSILQRHVERVKQLQLNLKVGLYFVDKSSTYSIYTNVYSFKNGTEEIRLRFIKYSAHLLKNSIYDVS